MSGGRDGTIRFWNPNRAPEEPVHRTMPIRQKGQESKGDWFAQVVPWSFSADSQSLFVVDRSSGDVIRFGGTFFEQKQSVMKTGAGDCGVVFLPKAGLMGAGSNRGEMQIWNLDQERVRERVQVGKGMVIPVAIPDPDTVWLWDVAASEVQEWHRGKQTKRVTLPGHVTSETAKWPLTSHNNQVICFNGGGLIDMMGQRLVEVPAFTAVNNAFSKDGRWFAGPRTVNIVSLWQVSSLVPENMKQAGARGGLPVFAGDLSPKLQLSGGPNGFTSVAFSADDTRLAGGGQKDEAVKIWETEGFHGLISLTGSGSNFGITAFSPDGNVIGSVNDQGILHLWKAPSFREIKSAEGPGK